MEENKNVEQNETKTNETKTNVKNKKWIPYTVVAVAVIVLIVVLCLVLGKGPKKAVKNFVAGMDKFDAEKIVDSMDYVGSVVWGEEEYDYKNFTKEDYKEFVEKYDKYDKSKVEKEIKDGKTMMKGMFELAKTQVEKNEVKVKEFKEVKELGKDLNLVNVTIEICQKLKDQPENKRTDDMTFVVYKNKIVYTNAF